jgi:hypothetical protein
MSTWSRRNPGADTIGRLPGRDQRESARETFAPLGAEPRPQRLREIRLPRQQGNARQFTAPPIPSTIETLRAPPVHNLQSDLWSVRLGDAKIPGGVGQEN